MTSAVDEESKIFRGHEARVLCSESAIFEIQCGLCVNSSVKKQKK